MVLVVVLMLVLVVVVRSEVSSGENSSDVTDTSNGNRPVTLTW